MIFEFTRVCHFSPFYVNHWYYHQLFQPFIPNSCYICRDSLTGLKNAKRAKKLSQFVIIWKSTWFENFKVNRPLILVLNKLSILWIFLNFTKKPINLKGSCCLCVDTRKNPRRQLRPLIVDRRQAYIHHPYLATWPE